MMVGSRYLRDFRVQPIYVYDYEPRKNRTLSAAARRRVYGSGFFSRFDLWQR